MIFNHRYVFHLTEGEELRKLEISLCYQSLFLFVYSLASLHPVIFPLFLSSPIFAHVFFSLFYLLPVAITFKFNQFNIPDICCDFKWRRFLNNVCLLELPFEPKKREIQISFISADFFLLVSTFWSLRIKILKEILVLTKITTGRDFFFFTLVGRR